MNSTINGSSDRALTLHKCSVMVVDDDSDALDILRLILTNHGATVIPVRNGFAALQIFQNTKIDLILCDIAMPHMDGYELLRKLRSYESRASKFDRNAATVPAIAISGYNGAEDLRRSVEAGYAIHIGKPVMSDELLTAIAAVMKMWR